MGKHGPDAIDLMFEHKRFGQKNGQGFYIYETDKKGKPKKLKDAQVPELLASLSKESKEFTEQEIIERMMIPMINEVVLCLEQNIVASPQEADMALVYGLGFPPFRGGVCRYLDSLGIDNYIQSCEQYQHLGALYQVPQLLKDMAASGKSFYSEQQVTSV
ncbi:enoyl-CoA hydratase [Vibrio ishigakensis]|nr:enoyl-CoA hydratase [Vibrio ishigakensis]